MIVVAPGQTSSSLVIKTAGGVTGTTADDTDVTYPAEVYNLFGMRVMICHDDYDLKSLPKGIYIINGKKVVAGI